MSITVSNVLDGISIVIALIGFGITIFSVNKARKLSAQIRDDLKRVNSISDFSSAISCMVEIKTLHRSGSWTVLPDKYSSLRKQLIIIRATNPDIVEESKKIIQSTVSALSSLENTIETANCQHTSPSNISQLNKIISKQMDKLHPILIEMQNKVGR
jgi:hypothetical protein